MCKSDITETCGYLTRVGLEPARQLAGLTGTEAPAGKCQAMQGSGAEPALNPCIQLPLAALLRGDWEVGKAHVKAESYPGTGQPGKAPTDVKVTRATRGWKGAGDYDSAQT